MRVGDYVVLPLNEGHLLFDGGVAFGAIPRTQWSRLMRPDEDNRVVFANTFFLIQGHGKNVLVDVGVGTKASDEELARRFFARTATATELLRNVEIEDAEIDLVLPTHLHYASVGNLTRLDDEGVLVPTYAKARVVVQEGEWEKGIHPNLRTRSLYNKEDFEPLLWHQCLDLVEGDKEVLPGLWIRRTGGHTENHQIVVIESKGEGAIFWGDLVPSIHHLQLNAISAHDLEPLVSMERKGTWLERAIKERWVHFFSRDPEIAAALVTGDLRKLGDLELDPLFTL